ncbi:glycoside hydrolase family 16 protein [Coniophora puteana RWD-64-598 SS2]|uniref:Glycoside hydrolase family 16 protein n=1 Tax=Coniophora puteana (strain RWD-64-598) TaxID=741705 RepID=A0A5M3MH12_CONPW|nr:glycoside hydrolase family 16 protein [Coniophora puteana RWD-64-598 SS2]EIW78296.1 glycoside hydrolase family 16 protein [Coniophora puteana RWD-64-598 SS2]
MGSPLQSAYDFDPSSLTSRLSSPPNSRPSSQALRGHFPLPADPKLWGSNTSPDHPDPDDWLHEPDPKKDRNLNSTGHIFTFRGISNLGCLLVLILCILGLFAGYPIASALTSHPRSNNGGSNIGGINASGQVPKMFGDFALIDADTPSSAYTYKSFNDGSEWQLVFSDEFEQDGRTFWPGDDPFWEATNLHNWQTGDLEWYHPSAVATNNGAMEITFSEKEINNLDYMSASVSTWNKFCFTGGLILASVTLPGSSSVSGMWPAIWTMGNLGRVGYGATLDGMWPYVYDSCDIGTVAAQTHNGGPAAAVHNGDSGALSTLPGQRLSRCTCPGESHPGPKHSDGTFVGRSAPEIDIFEGQVNGGSHSGAVSQSAQWAPMNAEYEWDKTGNYHFADTSITAWNPYQGGTYQQPTSAVTNSNYSCYDQESGCFATYGYEYKPGYKNDSAYITWINNGVEAWTFEAGGMAADPETEVNDRPISEEPMYIIANVAMATGFSFVDTANLVFPTKMRIDWVRVYQPKDAVNVGCDPKEYPTSAYIQQYAEAYNNPNLTTWVKDYKQTIPKNSFLGEC